eukprot:10369091-Karenia_brevis.AAC.1
MNQSLSKEKEKAQRTTTSEVYVHQSETTSFMPEEGAIRDEEMEEAHANQHDSGSMTSKLSMTAESSPL